MCKNCIFWEPLQEKKKGIGWCHGAVPVKDEGVMTASYNFCAAFRREWPEEAK